MLNQRIKAVLKVLLALIVLLFVFVLFERGRGQISLATYKRQLIAKGEKLTFGELIPPVPDGENSVPELVQATEQLQCGVVMPHNYPPVMRVQPSGRAIVCFREHEWIDTGTYRDGECRNEKVTNRWEQLALDLKTNAAALAQIRAALQKPVLNNKLDYDDPFKVFPTHPAAAKRAGQWLCAASQLALNEGRLSDAADNLVALVRLPRLLAEDRLLISELVRFVIAPVARAATWEALQADGWTDADLARFQQAWETEDFLRTMASSFEGERALCHAVFDLLRRSNAEAVGLFSFYVPVEFVSGESQEPPRIPWWRTARLPLVVYSFIWRFAWLDQNLQRYLEQMQQLIELTRTTASDNSRPQILTGLQRLEARVANKNFYDKLRHPDPESVATITHALKAAFRAQTKRALTISAIALKRYQLKHGKLPESLDALVPEFLPSVPIDCMDAKPIKYRLNPDGSFLLYSVGEDGIDHGGDMSPLPGKEKSRRPWDRRDFVWPAPALPEEIESYREEIAG